mmetsp:Transcript_11044/g.12632  ORF Transcript_11044/g.12632 Transcript_11044/m.12632 type:complete len:281 (-) Transcript_11044:84-926(-)|eukprot:CAMPEP_0184020466 /NCGR_PEP_ID=MMETSP0954-20121128/9365_1 /TAXON_ID=627963 /ORGANISM="Aplanochytrium sp, Strain PBS07" /LENGTH=280 /DNA_ID=CAMNT_0026302331 /DNA_START=62 /DNA_END=904 /DNA_ORIENTATION=-
MAKEMPLSSWSCGPPVNAVVPPGTCQFTEEWKKVTLKSKKRISGNSYVFTFSTPDETLSLNLPTCSCILAKGGTDAEGKPAVRPYTPMSTNAMIGEFELLIKVYPDGVFGNFIKNSEIGAEIEFKQIPINVKIQYPFGSKKYYGMLVGGSGITPMIQALHAILGNEKDKGAVNMLFGNKTEGDILAHETLDDWTSTHGDRLSVTHVLSHENAKSSWKGQRGYITKDLIQKHIAPPSDDVLVFVCGPPVMYDVFCGPRNERDKVTGILGELGYNASQVYKF